MAYPATLPSVLAVPARDHFAPIKAAFLLAAHLGVVAAFWQTTWVAVGVCLLLHALGGGLGICVGYHRLLTHRSFKCPTVVEYTLAFLGSLTMEGGPIDWVANHRQHHQYSDAAGDPHSAREGFFWSHVLWMMWTPKQAAWNQVTERYTPDLLRVPFYRFMGRTYLEWSALLAVVLYLMALCRVGHVRAFGHHLPQHLVCKLRQPHLWLQDFRQLRPLYQLLVGGPDDLWRRLA
jgi:stearoyl-CoA desaturase (delta-9 desaturase)